MSETMRLQVMDESGPVLRIAANFGLRDRDVHDDSGISHSEIGLAVLEAQLRVGILVVDAGLSVQYASKRAAVLMKEGSGLQMRAGRLHVDRASVGRRLQDTIGALLAGHTPNEFQPALVGIPNSDGRIHFAVKVLTTVQSADRDNLALLIVVDLVQQDSVSRSSAASLFGLSDREAELADFFSQGMRLDEIAQAMGVAVNTARVHLRSVFTKTGCSSQIELARLFALVP